MYFDDLCNEFSKLNQVQAIALGGSRAGKSYDIKSDYDLYLYVTEIPTEEERKAIIEKYCSYIELGNSFWELEDDCTLKDGIDIDILYRKLEDFDKDLYSVVFDCNSHNGYTTCMWHNLLNCKILYDKEGQLGALKQKYNVSYPEQLKNNIIDRNLKLLSGYLPSYQGQITKALGRNDRVSVNHRVTAFMESYFDIIFALNLLTHPGEKREVEYAVKNAKLLPKSFEKNINTLFDYMFADKNKTILIIELMVKNLKDLIAQ